MEAENQDYKKNSGGGLLKKALCKALESIPEVPVLSGLRKQLNPGDHFLYQPYCPEQTEKN